MPTVLANGGQAGAPLGVYRGRDRDYKATAAALGVGQDTVGKWRTRFAEVRLDGLSDEPRPGAPRTIGDAKMAEVIQRTLKTTPSNALASFGPAFIGRSGTGPRSQRKSLELLQADQPPRGTAGRVARLVEIG
jgi:hypothetical protein